MGGHKLDCAGKDGAEEEAKKKKAAEEAEAKRDTRSKVGRLGDGKWGFGIPINLGSSSSSSSSGLGDDKRMDCPACTLPVSTAPQVGRKMDDGQVYHNSCVNHLKGLGIKEVCVTLRPPTKQKDGRDELFEEATRRWYVLHVKYSSGPDDESWDAIFEEEDTAEHAAVMDMIQKAAAGNPEKPRGFEVSEQSDGAYQGHPDAQRNLGCMYRDGLGVKKDAKVAASWLRKAAWQGHADAQCNLAIMYMEAEGVPKSDLVAADWMRQAGELLKKAQPKETNGILRSTFWLKIWKKIMSSIYCYFPFTPNQYWLILLLLLLLLLLLRFLPSFANPTTPSLSGAGAHWRHEQLRPDAQRRGGRPARQQEGGGVAAQGGGGGRPRGAVQPGLLLRRGQGCGGGLRRGAQVAASR